MSIFTGAGVAIVTPMKANGEVNYPKLEELLRMEQMRLSSVELLVSLPR